MTNKESANAISYRDAGVDVAAGNDFVKSIKDLVASTHNQKVLGGIGKFAAFYELPNGYNQPVLVAATDGVGTKLKIAAELNDYGSIGIDLVAMCVNDIIVHGADPLFFLDYYASGKLNQTAANSVIASIVNGCKLADLALIGGETAEMPGVYHNNDFDIAGFVVGMVDKSQIIDGSRVKAGDSIIGIASSGLHANGFSLVRKIIEGNNISLEDDFGRSTFGEVLLTPTKIYVKAIKQLLKTININAAAHITGGGLLENLPRVLPANTQAIIDANSWPLPAIFKWLQKAGDIDRNEMFGTFNCGIGMTLVVSPQNVTQTLAQLKALGENAWVIGSIEAGDSIEPQVVV